MLILCLDSVLNPSFRANQKYNVLNPLLTTIYYVMSICRNEDTIENAKCQYDYGQRIVYHGNCSLACRVNMD